MERAPLSRPSNGRLPAVLVGCLTGVVLAGIAACAASPAEALPNQQFDYEGHIAGATTTVLFNVGRTASGHRVVRRFSVTSVPIDCSDSPDDTSSDGYRLKPQMKIRNGAFEGQGDWRVLLLDPEGSVSGRFTHPGVARGILKIRGELAGDGTHCHTGELHWRATKAAKAKHSAHHAYETQVGFTSVQSAPPSGARFYGFLQSPKHKCEVGRKVKVTEGTTKLGYTFGDSFGNWSLTRPSYTDGTGVYEAVAPKKVLRNGDVCKTGTGEYTIH
jgi:hypothetical protein